MSIARCSPFLFAAALLPAQTTHLVGPSGFAQIGGALLVAQPGDVILVEPGTYQHFTASVDVTIRATTPGTALVVGQWFTMLQPPPGQTVHLIGLNLGGVIVNGTTTLAECHIANAGMVLAVNHADLHLQRCTVRSLLGTGPLLIAASSAIVALDSRITIVDSLVEGPFGNPTGASSNPAIQLSASTLHATGLTARTGIGFNAPALRADATTVVWLSDSTLVSDPSICPVVAPVGRLARCTLIPNCGSPAVGPLLGVDAPFALHPGSIYTLRFTASPGTLVAVWTSPALATSILAELEQPLWLEPTMALPVAALVTDTTGTAVGAWQVPLVPALVNQTCFFQGFAGTQLPLLTSPRVGSVIY
ncbi:MAG: hypothetical protein WAT39_23730 [Planctomycetota bacterium]